MTGIPDPEARRNALNRLVDLTKQNILSCLQCGKCTSGCPFSDVMDETPHQMVHLAQLGMIDELMNCEGIWFCATCFTCVSRCPMEIDIAAISEAVRLMVHDDDIIVGFGPDKLTPEVARDAPQQALVSLYRKFDR